MNEENTITGSPLARVPEGTATGKHSRLTYALVNLVRSLPDALTTLVSRLLDVLVTLVSVRQMLW